MLEKALDIITNLADRYGVKSVVALLAIYLLADLIGKELVPGIPGSIAITVVAVGFFAFRHLEKINNGGAAVGRTGQGLAPSPEEQRRLGDLMTKSNN